MITNPARQAIVAEDHGASTTIALVTFYISNLQGTLEQVDALRIAYTEQNEADILAKRLLHRMLRANPNRFGTFTLTWPQDPGV